MKMLRFVYEKTTGKKAPYYYDYSILTIIGKPIRKFVAQVLAPNCPINNLRVFLYRFCGFRIGTHTFIGMKCYLDDMCYDLIKIGNHVTISYGVYFACHGKCQEHLPIQIKDGAYIGMRANIISNNREKISGGGITIGENAIIGAGSLVNRDIPAGVTAIGIPCHIMEEKSCAVSMLESRCQQHDELEVLQPCNDTDNSAT